MKTKTIISSAFLILFLSGCSFGLGGGGKSAGSIWKSSDGGKIWEVKKGGEKIDLISPDILSIAIDPQNSNVAYFGSRGKGIIKTDNGGDSWSFLNFPYERVYGIEINPKDTKIIFAIGISGERGKVFKTTDGGENWKEIYTSPSDGFLVYAIKIDINNPDSLFIATSDRQVIKTSDGGETWKNIYSGQDPIISIAVDSKNSNIIYMASLNGEVFISKDGGEKFLDIREQLYNSLSISPIIKIVEADPNNGNWMYLGGNPGILRTKDGGDNWEKVVVLNDPENFPVRAMAVNPKDSNEMIYGAAQTAYRSTDGGVNWSTFQLDSSKIVKVIKYSQSDPKLIFMGLDGNK